MSRTIALSQVEQKLRLLRPIIGLKSCRKQQAKLIVVTKSYHRHLQNLKDPVLEHPGYRVLEATRRQLYSLIKTNHMVNVVGF